MGAQTWDRLAQFRKRFDDWADLQGEVKGQSSHAEMHKLVCMH